MPGVVRSLLVFAAADALVLQPLAQRNQRGGAAVHIDYRTHTVTHSLQDPQLLDADHNKSLEAHGIVGLLNVLTSSYLIAISGRRQAAQIWGRPIYVITDVTFIPLSSQKDAEDAIAKAKKGLRNDKQNKAAEVPDDTLSADGADNDTLTSLEDTLLDDEQALDPEHPPSKPRQAVKEPGIAEDVMGRKGLYGRFADRWFSNRGWAVGQRRNQGLSSQDDLSRPDLPHGSQPSSRNASPALVLQGDIARPEPGEHSTNLEGLRVLHVDVEAKTKDITTTLLPKLLQTTKLLLLSKTFYFAYNYDITRSLARQDQAQSDASLHRNHDPQYVWNAHLFEPLVNGGCDEFVLPVMQGFIGQRAFSVAESLRAGAKIDSDAAKNTTSDEEGHASSTSPQKKDKSPNDQIGLLLTLISRRSTNRAGFRYLRRGIDEEGNVANSVETEQILSSTDWHTSPTHSFVQVRGSIPLFFTQVPYTFKPLPSLHGSREANQEALGKHFNLLASRYKDVIAVSLIDRHGSEIAVGEAYEDQVSLLNSSGGLNDGRPLQFEWFEFHKVCSGMKFENVSLLIETLRPFLFPSAWTTINTKEPTQHQSGVVRTNCMDCLDRTNVVQSAIALHILQQQLPPSFPYTISSTLNTAFNTLWADNGDAISLTYAGTAALKGDYVRTRRRTPLGALTDLSLTLSRYYRNLFDDFFAQAALDYLLGNVDEQVFAQFHERMTTADPARDLGRARQSAITSAANVIVDGDEEDHLLAGWVLAAPAAPSLSQALVEQPPTPTSSMPVASATPAQLRAQPFREVVLLLTEKALYTVAYDWDTEKVRGFERVPLAQVRKIQHGTYISETQTEGQTDPGRNVGLIITFDASDSAQASAPTLVRMNTRVVGGAEGLTPTSSHDDQPRRPQHDKKATDSVRLLAYKALPRQTTPSRNAHARSRSHPTPHQPHETDQVRDICEQVSRTVGRSRGSSGFRGKEGGLAEVAVEEKSIVSAEDARRSTTYAETIGYGIKRLVWG